MPTDWKANSRTQTRQDFVLQHLSEEEIRAFWDVPPFPGVGERMSHSWLTTLCVGSGGVQGERGLLCLSQWDLSTLNSHGAFVSVGHKVDTKKARSIASSQEPGVCWLPWLLSPALLPVEVIDPRPATTVLCSATKPLSCWHFNCFIPGGNQLCWCDCLIH